MAKQNASRRVEQAAPTDDDTPVRSIASTLRRLSNAHTTHTLPALLLLSPSLSVSLSSFSLSFPLMYFTATHHTHT